MIAAALFQAVESWLQTELHFMVASGSIVTVEQFAQYAAVGPALDTMTYPYMLWYRITTEVVTALASADANGTTAPMKLKDITSPGNNIPPSLPSKNPKLSRGMALREFNLEYCAGAVFQGSTSCRGQGCPFVHKPPVKGSADAKSLKSLKVKYPKFTLNANFNI